MVKLCGVEEYVGMSGDNHWWTNTFSYLCDFLWRWSEKIDEVDVTWPDIWLVFIRIETMNLLKVTRKMTIKWGCKKWNENQPLVLGIHTIEGRLICAEMQMEIKKWIQFILNLCDLEYVIMTKKSFCLELVLIAIQLFIVYGYTCINLFAILGWSWKIREHSTVYIKLYCWTDFCLN